MSILKVVGIGAIAAVGGVMGAVTAGFSSMSPEVHDSARKHLGKNGVEIMVGVSAVTGAVIAAAPFIAACCGKKD